MVSLGTIVRTTLAGILESQPITFTEIPTTVRIRLSRQFSRNYCENEIFTVDVWESPWKMTIVKPLYNAPIQLDQWHLVDRIYPCHDSSKGTIMIIFMSMTMPPTNWVDHIGSIELARALYFYKFYKLCILIFTTFT